jgi:hypothetical protein
MALLKKSGFFPWPRKFHPFLAVALFALGLSVPAPVNAQSDASREYQIKAAFLYNFVQFVKWPSSAFPGPQAPFCIGVLGDDPFGSALDATVQGESINGRRFAVLRSTQLDDLEGCQMIFICRSEEGQLPGILAQLKARQILTVSDIPGFADEGGDIDFYLSGDKVRFEIDPESARQRGLQISSQMLALGKIVEL